MLYSEDEVICFSELDRKRHIYSTRIQHSKLADDPHITSLAKIRNLLPFLHTESHKAGSNALCLLQRLSIGGRLPYVGIKILLPEKRA